MAAALPRLELPRLAAPGQFAAPAMEDVVDEGCLFVGEEASPGLAQSLDHWNEALCNMAVALPGCKPEVLRRALREHGGNADNALAALLTGGMPPFADAGAEPVDSIALDDDYEEVKLVSEKEVDPRTQHLAWMKNAVPDCEEEHLKELLDKHAGSVDAALEELLSGPYPKKAKRPRLQPPAGGFGSSSSSSSAPAPGGAGSSSDAPPVPRLGADFWFDPQKRRDALGQRPVRPELGHYPRECLEVLLEDFVELNRPCINKTLQHHQFYALAWRYLSISLAKPELPADLVRLKCPRKQRPERDLKTLRNGKLREEVAFVREYRDAEAYKKRQEEVQKEYLKVCEAEGLLLECECCFAERPGDEMAQCAAGTHLFCRDCVARCVETQLGGAEVHGVACFSTAGCPEQLPPRELRRCLPPELWENLQTRQQRSSIRNLLEDGAAGCGQLEQCPFCDFVMVMDVPKELNKIFICHNEECGKESCRLCREENHIPLRCHEVEKKAQTNHRLAVEERMSACLLRHCPACKRKGIDTAILKEDGCNKMTCPSKKCKAFFCYHCNQEIPKNVGYGHFCQHPTDPGKKCTKCTKCPLWNNKNFEKEEQQRVVREGAAFHKEYLEQHPEEKLEESLGVLEGEAEPPAEPEKKAKRHRHGRR